MDKDLNNARNPGETFEEYKMRQKRVKKLLNSYLRGRIWYYSGPRRSASGFLMKPVPYRKESQEALAK